LQRPNSNGVRDGQSLEARKQLPSSFVFHSINTLDRASSEQF